MTEGAQDERIAIVGPPGTETAAVAGRIADVLGVSVHSTDDFPDERWTALGYDASADIRAWAHGGAYASYRLLSALRVRAIEKLLMESARGLYTFRPDFIVQDDPVHRARVATLLGALTVVALLPTPDTDENAALLDADLTGFPDWSVVNAYWVRQPSNERLATHTVYTTGKTEEQTRDEILQLTAMAGRDIVLIGPKLTGKTTLGRMLADALGKRQVSLDMIGHRYLGETDYDPAAAGRVYDRDGIFGWLRYMRPYEAYIAERALQDETDCLIDFGGGHSVYEDDTLLTRVQHALTGRSVVLVLPSPDKDDSIRILKQRFDADVASERRLKRLLVTDPSYQILATHTVYTKGKTTDEITAEALALLR